MRLPSRRLRCGIFALLASALTFAACGGGDRPPIDDGEPDSGPIADATSPPSTDANGDVFAAPVDAMPDSSRPPDAKPDVSEPTDAPSDAPPVDATDGEVPDATSSDAADGSPDAADGSPGATDGSPDAPGTSPDASDGAPPDATSDASPPDAAPSCDAGFLDPTFGTCGVFSTSRLAPLLGTNLSGPLVRGMVTEDSGKIVLAGYFATFSSLTSVTSELPWVMRVLADGSGIDPSFASGGARALPSLGPGPNYDVAIVQQSDGKLLVSSQCPTTVPGKASPDPCVTRLTADGALDSTYGSSGVVHVSLSSTEAESGGVVALDPQGLALFEGFTNDGTTLTAYIVRLTTAGVADPAFNGGAPLIVAQASVNDGIGITGIAALPSGRIFVGAGPEVAQGIQLEAFTSSGAPDNTINPGADSGLANVLPLPNGVQVSALRTGADGSLYVFGNTYPTGAPSQAAIVKLTPAGTLDQTFGTAGETLFPPAPINGFEGASLEGSTFYVTGFGSVYKVGLDGALATAWGSGGSVPTNWGGPGNDWVNWLIAARVRGPLVAGTGTTGQTVLLAQLLP
jgi:uncharacterized delta-60 repeat protein